METVGSEAPKGVASYPALLARLALAAAAVAIIALHATELRGYDACNAARRQVIGAAAAGDRARQADATAGVQAHCRGAAAIISVAAVLHREGRDREAQRLARQAADEEPQNATAWNALAVTADGAGDAVTARRAARRAVALSPLDPPPVPTGGGSGP
jgi:Flp pilus assembly protein TadD